MDMRTLRAGAPKKGRNEGKKCQAGGTVTTEAKMGWARQTGVFCMNEVDCARDDLRFAQHGADINKGARAAGLAPSNLQCLHLLEIVT